MSGSAVYYLMLGLFCFGAFTAGINTLGIVPVKVPSSEMSMGVTTVTDFSNSATSQPAYDAGSVIVSFLKIIGGGVTGIFASPVIIHDWMVFAGAESTMSWVIAGIFGAPLTLVVLVSLYDIFTGRQTS